ncbi:helix-turn-helix domain-containing protein [Staphylococcus simiae]|uniref:Transcriptional regulator, XRE family protein n=1 Tax=Staphylococcus simiae CCM 7213 = CCUG 51256 TaxID=911238 RepID=G5JFZ9_9STAP|nr:helix-turn-helix transcriptional regulator [Staphylococcus simiae]EHJ08889.1 transcriptional regulator, XRE family protein [Staphylococcus simiae CCM 7213 = CCUG 51256]PNZ10944.1 XRE family transcriptional regulator [Staphylococcus simiae]SNV60589.1 transcriptional regulator [Staphylococcus simiae]
MENRIAELRKEKGLTLKKLSEELNVRDNTLSQYETGKRSPQLGLLQEIANFFNVSIEYLTKYTDQRDYPLENDEDALFLIKKLFNEPDFHYTHLSINTSLNLCMWIINNENLINSKYPELKSTTQWFIKDIISENKILNHYSKNRQEINKTLDKIDSLLLDEDYFGATPREVLTFMEESQRIGHEKTKELLSHMKTLPDSVNEED